MTASVRREERRLKSVFVRALLLVGVTPIAIPLACGDGGTGGAGPGAASATSSSSTGGGAGPGTGGAAVDAGPDAEGDAGDAGAKCAPAHFEPDPPDMCGNYVHLPCGLPKGVMPSANCYLLLSDCQAVCADLFFNCHATDQYCVDGGIVPDRKGNVDIDCSLCPGGVGRIPAGLLKPRRRGALRPALAASALGAYFATAAHLEDASVHAFRRLRRELSAHGAPTRLLRAAERAARDEVRHARLTGRLARRFGDAPCRARVARLATRPLAEVAIENAVEGCVRETFGAIVATFQAAHAADAEIARIMESVARDETRHAALSWAVARWAWPRLDEAARAALIARCREALAALERAPFAASSEDLIRRAGLPDAAQHRALAGLLEAELWQGLRS